MIWGENTIFGNTHVWNGKSTRIHAGYLGKLMPFCCAIGSRYGKFTYITVDVDVDI